MPAGKKRLFFALWPDGICREAIVEGTSTAIKNSKGRAVKPENLHITLAFLHAVETSLIPCIVSAAERAAGAAFDLDLSQVGFWSRSRILWLGSPRKEPGRSHAANALAGALWRELAACGFTPEQRRYEPHVTLARRATVPTWEVLARSIRWPVRNFVLVESITGRRQSEYIVLKTFSLRDNA